uniref:Putative secreted protein n=1 Tax=Anopheles triannulatus TaxID=58253 RepID=A0A2M4B657_9DIPT
MSLANRTDAPVVWLVLSPPSPAPACSLLVPPPPAMDKRIQFYRPMTECIGGCDLMCPIRFTVKARACWLTN